MTQTLAALQKWQPRLQLHSSHPSGVGQQISGAPSAHKPSPPEPPPARFPCSKCASWKDGSKNSQLFWPFQRVPKIRITSGGGLDGLQWKMTPWDFVSSSVSMKSWWKTRTMPKPDSWYCSNREIEQDQPELGYMDLAFHLERVLCKGPISDPEVLSLQDLCCSSGRECGCLPHRGGINCKNQEDNFASPDSRRTWLHHNRLLGTHPSDPPQPPSPASTFFPTLFFINIQSAFIDVNV